MYTSMSLTELKSILDDPKMYEILWSKIRHKEIHTLSVFFSSEEKLKEAINTMLKLHSNDFIHSESNIHIASLVTICSSQPDLLNELISCTGQVWQIKYGGQTVLIDAPLTLSKLKLVERALTTMFQNTDIRDKKFPIISNAFTITILKNNAKYIQDLGKEKDLTLFAFPALKYCALQNLIFQGAYPFEINENKTVCVNNPYSTIWRNLTLKLDEFETGFPVLHALYRQ